MPEDIEECKHKETRFLYSDYTESNKAVAHDCDMVICCDCGETVMECGKL